VHKLDKCYAGYPPDLHWIPSLPTKPWLLKDHLNHLMLPTECDEDGNPDKEKIFDIIEIHGALVNFDKMPYVERYGPPGGVLPYMGYIGICRGIGYGF